MRTKSILGAVAALVLAGCGGGGGGGTTERGDVSGGVFDADGSPVRDALVYVDAGRRRETRTDSAGAYVLRGVSAEDLLVRARTTADGLTFVGQNLARVYGGEREPSVNITLVAQNSQARLVGFVTTANGRVAKGLRVVARPTDGVTLSSSSTLTDNDGYYSIDGLIRGVEYRVLANANGQGEDARVVTLGAQTQQNLTLGNPSNPNLAAPQNLDAVAYTTPGDITRGARQAEALEAVKRRLDPTRAARLARRKAAGRNTSLGRPIEVDLFWDDYTTTDTVGYGIYRRVGANGSNTTFYLQDPLAAYYADGDDALLPETEYSYAITAISSSYADNPNEGESAFSNRISTTPLADMTLNSPSGATVRWNAVSGAATYTVFAYDEYPGLGVDPINGPNGQTPSGASLTVTRAGGGSLTTGQTYYYVVVGERTDGSARTLSIVGTLRP